MEPRALVHVPCTMAVSIGGDQRTEGPPAGSRTIDEDPNGETSSAGDQATMSHPGTTAVLVPHVHLAACASGGGRRPECTKGRRSAHNARGGSPTTLVDGAGPGSAVRRTGRGASSPRRPSGGTCKIVHPHVCVSV
eukprot:2806813-Alexandrium_andersonii.AAC.1